ncbi:MAG: DMT family transporter [Candidatus Thorarchaeota archaeon]|nr:DMT family transporter [Candidatus Thorarchaeota archaeon]
MVKVSLAYLAIIVTTILWASSLIFAKLIFAEVGPIVFVALRYTLATPFLFVLAFHRRKRQTRGSLRANWKILLVTGLSGPFISQVLQYIGLEMTVASDALLLLNLTPIFAVILAAPLLDERITLDKIVGLILATLGATLVVMNASPDFTTITVERVLGNIIVIVSTLFFAINGIAGKVAVKSTNTVSTTFYSTLFSVPFIWFTAALFDDVTVLLTMSIEAWAIVSWIAVVNTVIAFMLYYESMKYIESSRVQIILNLIGVWGVIMSILVLNEIVTLLQILGGLLTIIGVVIAQITQTRHKSDKVELYQ